MRRLEQIMPKKTSASEQNWPRGSYSRLRVIGLIVVAVVAAAGTLTTIYYYWHLILKDEKSDLLGRLRYSKSILLSPETCNMTQEEFDSVERSLDNAINSVQLDNDLPSAERILNSVRDELAKCPVSVTNLSLLLYVMLALLVPLGLALLIKAKIRRTGRAE